MDKKTIEIISSAVDIHYHNRSEIKETTIFLPKNIETILLEKEMEHIHFIQKILLCGSIEVKFNKCYGEETQRICFDPHNQQYN